MLTDRTIGWLLITGSLTWFAYYTAWLLLMPFVDHGHPFHRLFPDREWALRVPIVCGLVAATALLTFIALVMVGRSSSGSGSGSSSSNSDTIDGRRSSGMLPVAQTQQQQRGRMGRTRRGLRRNRYRQTDDAGEVLIQADARGNNDDARWRHGQRLWEGDEEQEGEDDEQEDEDEDYQDGARLSPRVSLARWQQHAL